MKYVMGAYDWTIPTALPLSRCYDQSDIDLFGVDIDTFDSDNGFVDVARYTFEDFIGKTVLDPIGYEVTFSDGTSDYTT